MHALMCVTQALGFQVLMENRVENRLYRFDLKSGYHIQSAIIEVPGA